MGGYYNTEGQYLEDIDGFKIVVVKRGEMFHGRAWPQEKYLSKVGATGTNMSEVLAETKRLARADFSRAAQVLRATLPDRHAASLGRHGENLTRSITSNVRVSHCYNCNFPVDNREDLECSLCGWIICNNCTACGCGYTKRI